MRKTVLPIYLLLVLALLFSESLQAQNNKVRLSLKAGVSQTIGVDTDITIVYSRPGVKGRKIWGDLVPYGMAPGNKYSKNNPFPWRAGANENTTIEFSKNVIVEGEKLNAGKYGVYMIPSEKEWTIIFSNKNDIWGSYLYDAENDALRINVNPQNADHQEWLQYGFEKLAGTSATAYLHWEKIKIPFNIEVSE
ncbi:MAG: DUF2911 domain-containing protein [Melioribacteraceae bacterium]|nr:DUF2911 domain-containing protein [Melioribacteraceae bacterium]